LTVDERSDIMTKNNEQKISAIFVAWSARCFSCSTNIKATNIADQENKKRKKLFILLRNSTIELQEVLKQFLIGKSFTSSYLNNLRETEKAVEKAKCYKCTYQKQTTRLLNLAFKYLSIIV
jgi:hypothetical protein